MLNRRKLLTVSTGAALGGASTAIAKQNASTETSVSSGDLTDLSFLRTEPLADAERLRAEMRQRNIDAIVAVKPANVFYLTNHWPQLDRMGFEDTTIAVFSADRKKPLALVMHAFLYYYTHSPESTVVDRLVFPYTNPTGPALSEGVEPPAAPARTMRVAEPDLVTERDRHRQQMFSLTRPASADPSWALKKALDELGLQGASLGIDNPALEAALVTRGFEGSLMPAENAIRTARLAKSETELRLMRIAAENNVQAAMAAAKQTRVLGRTQLLRQAFYAEAGRRGNVGRFMVIAGSSSPTLNEELVDGTSVSIDCVSACRHYHGDFGRTIFIGEPRKAVRDAGKAIYTAWEEIKSQLRPGMRFADIPRIGRETLKKQGADLVVSFTPHSVGLFHTDHPQPSLLEPRDPQSLVLERNMILSVDCPLFLSGFGGTIHFENLMLIGADGATPIHSDPPPVVIV